MKKVGMGIDRSPVSVVRIHVSIGRHVCIHVKSYDCLVVDHEYLLSMVNHY